eukprot:1968183-Pyramimonas_sp.AAC.1
MRLEKNRRAEPAYLLTADEIKGIERWSPRYSGWPGRPGQMSRGGPLCSQLPSRPPQWRTHLSV